MTMMILKTAPFNAVQQSWSPVYGRAYGGFYGGFYGEPDADAAVDAEAVKKEKSTDELVTEYLPVVKTIVEEVSDASRQVEVLDAQIANTRALMRRAPWMAGVLKMRLRKLQARRRAAARRLDKQREGESSVRTWRALGQVAAVAGIGLLVAGVIRLTRRED
jgi:hypothetical protein